MSLQQFGIVGLEVMGRNIALNIEEKGFPIAVYNRTTSKAEEFVKENPGKNIKMGRTPQEFVALLERPRRILLMVKAGGPTDATIAALQPFLEPGDILIDGGNALYTDTERRENTLRPTGLKFFGMGVSGGEEGARHGPSMMPGGDRESYNYLKPILDKIAAKAPSDGVPCVTYCGERSAGHFVKMVHNGIEYGDMQLIAEAYDLLKNVAGLDNEQLKAVFEEWNASELQSFLIDITTKVIDYADPQGKGALVEQIRDVVGMKGTGTWTIKAGLDLLIPLPTMAAAVDMREISMLKDQRTAASKILSGPKPTKFKGDLKAFIKDVRYFYVHARMDEPHVCAAIREKNRIIFHENDFEIFIDPDGDRHDYYEFEVNALNTIWELALPRPYRDGGKPIDPANIDGLRSAVHVDGTLNDPSDTDRGWSVDVAIPWSGFAPYAGGSSLPPRDGDQWRVNFSRVEWLYDIIDGQYRKIPKGMRDEDNWVWTPQGPIDMHRPERWGYVQFSASSATRTFRPDTTLPARDRLMQVYYRQSAYRARHGRYSHTLADLDLPVTADLTLTATDATYTATLTLSGSHTLTLDHTAKLARVSASPAER